MNCRSKDPVATSRYRIAVFESDDMHCIFTVIHFHTLGTTVENEAGCMFIASFVSVESSCKLAMEPDGLDPMDWS